MKKKTFKAILMSGHKDNAVEVPFNPTEVWVGPELLWRNRRGHRVKGKLNGHHFESCIVPRQKKFYLLINADSSAKAGASEGVEAQVTIEPLAL